MRRFLERRFFLPIFSVATLKSIGLTGKNTSKRPCSCRSSSRTRSSLPTRIEEPAERHLRARFMGREFMFKTLTWPQKSVSQFGMPVGVLIFAGPLPRRSSSCCCGGRCDDRMDAPVKKEEPELNSFTIYPYPYPGTVVRHIV